MTLSRLGSTFCEGIHSKTLSGLAAADDKRFYCDFIDLKYYHYCTHDDEYYTTSHVDINSCD